MMINGVKREKKIISFQFPLPKVELKVLESHPLYQKNRSQFVRQAIREKLRREMRHLDVNARPPLKQSVRLDYDTKDGRLVMTAVE